MRERVVQELEFKKIVDHDPKARLGRLHDMVSARELCIEFQDIRQRALAERGLALEDVMWDIESARRFIRAMPSTEVALALKTAWHRNGERIWEVNDIHDIDALALAVPYCDIVVTEKACHHILNVAAFHKRMNTTLLHRLNDLPQALSEKKSKRI